MRKTDCCEGECRVESVVSVDERGQMVLPKALRQRLGIRPGEKLAVISWQQAGGACCLSLVKASALTGMAERLLGPLIQDLTGNRKQRRKGGE